MRELQHSGSLKATPQPENGITYAQKLTKEEAKINWQENAEIVARKIRAFNPVPAAWTEFGGKPMKIWAAKSVVQQGEVGTILAANADGIVVACGKGAAQITELQPAGAKRMTAAAFLAGRSLAVGAKFE